MTQKKNCQQQRVIFLSFWEGRRKNEKKFQTYSFHSHFLGWRIGLFSEKWRQAETGKMMMIILSLFFFKKCVGSRDTITMNFNFFHVLHRHTDRSNVEGIKYFQNVSNAFRILFFCFLRIVWHFLSLEIFFR